MYLITLCWWLKDFLLLLIVCWCDKLIFALLDKHWREANAIILAAGGFYFHVATDFNCFHAEILCLFISVEEGADICMDSFLFGSPSVLLSCQLMNFLTM